MDLSTTARVKAAASITGTDRDSLIAVLVTAYSAEFEAALNRYVQSSSRTEVLRVARGQRLLVLRGMPITSVTSVKLSTSRDFTDSTALTANVDYVSELETGSVLLTEIANTEQYYAEVVYTGGMAANQGAFTTAYPDISNALDTQVVEHLRRLDTGTMEGTASDGNGNFSPSVYELTKYVRGVLARYRRLCV